MSLFEFEIEKPPLKWRAAAAIRLLLTILLLLAPGLARNHANAETPEQGAKASIASNHLERQMFSKLNALWKKEGVGKKLDPKQANRLASLGENPDLTSIGENEAAIGSPTPSGTIETLEDPPANTTEREGVVAEIEQGGRDPETLDIGVFQDEEFELCGHSRFSARLTGSATGYNSIIVKSRDRTIPDIPFRGFERTFPLETRADFWPGCSVIAGFVDVAGVIRIGLSVRENRDFK